MKRIVKTDKAPGAVGPYSQAVAIPCKELLFCAGQVPLDPATQKLVTGDIQVQTRRALQNVQAVLEAAGSNLKQVVKTTVFLTSMADFKAMNEVYAEFFPSDPPARSAVAVKELPLGAQVEIEVLAYI